jgi:hypothetical protein
MWESFSARYRCGSTHCNFPAFQHGYCTWWTFSPAICALSWPACCGIQWLRNSFARIPLKMWWNRTCAVLCRILPSATIKVGRCCIIHLFYLKTVEQRVLKISHTGCWTENCRADVRSFMSISIIIIQLRQILSPYTSLPGALAYRVNWKLYLDLNKAPDRCKIFRLPNLFLNVSTSYM